MIENKPEIDLTAMDFPTDDLTVGMLRKTCPTGFDVVPTDDRFPAKRALPRLSLDRILAIVTDSERILADMAFKSALGQPADDDGRLGGREMIIENLSLDLIRFGLARGEHEAQEMIRGIEAQAETQARERGGQSR